MISGKDVRIENGNIIVNGNKYPIVQDVSELEEEVAALTETVGDETGGLVKDVATLESKLVKYTDVTILPITTGHTTPSVSQGGACYETLATYEALGVARDKIINVVPVNWSDLKKSFTLYLGATALTAMSNDDVSIYNSAGSTLIVRISHF